MLIKFLKSLFSVPDESKTKLGKKTMHTAPGRSNSKVNTQLKVEAGVQHVQYEKDIQRIHQEIGEITGRQEQDVVAFVKSKQITSTPLTEAEIKYIAANCEFSLRNGEPDPRVVEAINFAINLHAVKVQHTVSDILKKFDQ